MEDDMLTKLIAGTVAGTISMMIIGFLVFGLALDTYMKANTNRFDGLFKDPPNMILMVVSHLAFAGLLTMIAVYWGNIRNFVDGLKLGAIATLLVAIWTNTINEAFMDVYIGWVPILVDAAAATVVGAIVGGIIGAVLGMMDKKTEAA